MRTDVPSAHPTPVPNYDVEAAAAGASHPFDGDESRLVPMAVPVRTPASMKSGLDLRSTFVLMHVDGTSSIEQIAWATQLPLQETTKVFAELLNKRLIALAILMEAEAPPSLLRVRGADVKDEDSFANDQG